MAEAVPARPTTSPTAFATVDDLAMRWRPLTEQEKATAYTLLEDASDLIRTTTPRWQKATPTTLRRVTVAVVKRAMMADTSSLEGASGVVASESQTAGPYTRQFSYSNPSGDLFLTKAERRVLRGGTGGAFEVDLLPATRGGE